MLDLETQWKRFPHAHFRRCRIPVQIEHSDRVQALLRVVNVKLPLVIYSLLASYACTSVQMLVDFNHNDSVSAHSISWDIPKTYDLQVQCSSCSNRTGIKLISRNTSS